MLVRVCLIFISLLICGSLSTANAQDMGYEKSIAIESTADFPFSHSDSLSLLRDLVALQVRNVTLVVRGSIAPSQGRVFLNPSRPLDVYATDLQLFILAARSFNLAVVLKTVLAGEDTSVQNHEEIWSLFEKFQVYHSSLAQKNGVDELAITIDALGDLICLEPERLGQVLTKMRSLYQGRIRIDLNGLTEFDDKLPCIMKHQGLWNILGIDLPVNPQSIDVTAVLSRHALPSTITFNDQNQAVKFFSELQELRPPMTFGGFTTDPVMRSTKTQIEWLIGKWFSN